MSNDPRQYGGGRHKLIPSFDGTDFTSQRFHQLTEGHGLGCPAQNDSLRHHNQCPALGEALRPNALLYDLML